MGEFIPYEKLSKKEKRKMDRKHRTVWSELNPVTRVPENPKAYCRQKEKKKILEEERYYIGV